MDVFPPVIFENAIGSPRVVFARDGIFGVGAGRAVEYEFDCGGGGDGGGGDVGDGGFG